MTALKTEWHRTYPVLRTMLANYGECLSIVQEGKKTTRAVLVIISGDRSKTMFAGETIRFAAYDGILADLGKAESTELVPSICASWRNVFHSDGAGAMPQEEVSRLDGIVTRACARQAGSLLTCR